MSSAVGQPLADSENCTVGLLRVLEADHSTAMIRPPILHVCFGPFRPVAVIHVTVVVSDVANAGRAPSVTFVQLSHLTVMPDSRAVVAGVFPSSPSPGREPARISKRMASAANTAGTRCRCQGMLSPAPRSGCHCTASQQNRRSL
jgi:hypothetical protein